MFSLRALSRSLGPQSLRASQPALGRGESGRRWLLPVAVAAGLLGAFALVAAIRSRGSTPHPMQIVSGRSGPKLSESGRPERWLEHKLTVEIDDSVDRLAPGAREAIQQGFVTWLDCGAHVPELSFDSGSGGRVSLQSDGKNRVLVGPIDIAGHEQDLALTLGFSNAATGEILEADIVINSRHPFVVLDATKNNSDQTAVAEGLSCTGQAAVNSCDGRFDLQSVITHEVGHFLGLGEDRSNAAATMFFCTNPCETHKRDLATDDRTAILDSYSQADFSPNLAPACQMARRPAGDLPLTVWITLGFSAAALAARRRA